MCPIYSGTLPPLTLWLLGHGNFHLFTIYPREGTSASYYIYVGIILTNKETNTYSDVVQLMFKCHKEILVQFILSFVYYKFHDAERNGKLFCLDENRDKRLPCMLKHGIKVSANYSTNYKQELIHKYNKHRSNTHTLHMGMLHCSRKYKKIKNSKI